MSITEPDCLPFTNLDIDPSCWEEAQSSEKGIRLFFILANYGGTPSITLFQHREKRKICFDKSATLRISKGEVCFHRKKIIHCP